MIWVTGWRGVLDELKEGDVGCGRKTEECPA
jgi:hypothetical protein